jgi:hypothetical protein
MIGVRRANRLKLLQDRSGQPTRVVYSLLRQFDDTSGKNFGKLVGAINKTQGVTCRSQSAAHVLD